MYICKYFLPQKLEGSCYGTQSYLILNELYLVSFTYQRVHSNSTIVSTSLPYTVTFVRVDALEADSYSALRPAQLNTL